MLYLISWSFAEVLRITSVSCRKRKQCFPWLMYIRLPCSWILPVMEIGRKLPHVCSPFITFWPIPALWVGLEGWGFPLEVRHLLSPYGHAEPEQSKGRCHRDLPPDQCALTSFRPHLVLPHSFFFLVFALSYLAVTYNQDFPYQEELQQEQRE